MTMETWLCMIVSTVMMTSAMIIVILQCSSWRCSIFSLNFSLTCFCIVIVECTCVDAYACAEVVYGVVEWSVTAMHAHLWKHVQMRIFASSCCACMQHVFVLVCYFILLKCISVCILQRLTSPPPLLHRLWRQHREDMGREHAAAGRRAERSHEGSEVSCVRREREVLGVRWGGRGLKRDGTWFSRLFLNVVAMLWCLQSKMLHLMMKMMLRVLRLYFWWWSCGGGYEMSLFWMLLECFRLFSNFISVLSFVEMSCDIMWHDIIWHNIWYDIYEIMLDAFGMFSLVFQFHVCLIIW